MQRTKTIDDILATIKKPSDLVKRELYSTTTSALTFENSVPLTVRYFTLLGVREIIHAKIDPEIGKMNISDNELLTGQCILVAGETYDVSSIVMPIFESAKVAAREHCKFNHYLGVAFKLATKIGYDEIECKFTKELLNLHRNRVEKSIIREQRLNEDLSFYFVNSEFLVLVNRGLPKTTSSSQEFFATFFKLGDLIGYQLCNYYPVPGSPKFLEWGILEKYHVTKHRPHVDNYMLLNSRMGPNQMLHWFFKDGVAKRNYQFTARYKTVNMNSRMLMQDSMWDDLCKEFNIPEFDSAQIQKMYNDRAVYARLLKNRGTNNADH